MPFYTRSLKRGYPTFLNLTDTPDFYDGEAFKVVRVNETETGLEFVEPDTLQSVTDRGATTTNDIIAGNIAEGATVSGQNTGDQVGDGVTITGVGTAEDPFVSVGGGDLSAYAKLDGTNQPFTGSIKLGDNLKTIFGTGLDFEAYYNGTKMVFNPVAATSEIVFNEGGLDTDFRIESDTLPNAFFVNGVNGYVGINTSVPKTPVHISDGTSLSSAFDAEVLSTNVLLSESTGYTKFLVLSTSNTAATRSLMSFVRSRGSTTTPLTVAENDYVGDFLFGAYNGTEVENAASFGAYVDGTVTSTNVPMRISISTGNNVGDRTERLRITSTGNIKIPADSKKLYFGAGDDEYIEYDPTLDGLQTAGIFKAGEVRAIHKAVDGTAPVADGTYNFDGSAAGTVSAFTIKDGIITSITTR